MMSANVEAGLGLFALAAILVVLYGPWQWVWIDWYRQELFEVRAGLFDLAAAGRIQFDDPRYIALRYSMNDAISYAHRATWVRLIWFALSLKLIGEGMPTSRLRRAMRNVEDPALHAQIERLLERSRDALAKTLVLRAPVLWLPIIAAWGLSHILRGAESKAIRLSGQAYEEYQLAAEGHGSAVSGRRAVVA